MDLFRLFGHAKPRDAQDDGPFFDLHFPVPPDDHRDVRRRENNSQRSDDEEFDLEKLSPSCNGGGGGAASSPSPSHDVLDSAPPNKPVPGFFLQSAARIRSFHLRLLQKPKPSASIDLAPTPSAVPLSLGAAAAGPPGFTQRTRGRSPLSSGDPKEMIKASSATKRPPAVVSRRLRKSRSASAAIASVRSPPGATAKRDDSLSEQQDGIERAIAHCKRSLNRGA